MRAIRIAALLAASLFTGGAWAASSMAQMQCPNHAFYKGLTKGVCWRAIAPIRLMGSNMPFRKDAVAPAGAATTKVCRCLAGPGELLTIGITLGARLPLRSVEVVRNQYCFPMLGGKRLPMPNIGGGHQVGGEMGPVSTINNNTNFYWVHTYYYPLLAVMQLLDVPRCNPDGQSTLSLAHAAEWFPNLFKPGLSGIINPEAGLFTQAVGWMAMPVDFALQLMRPPPVATDKLFWANGGNGLVYPQELYETGTSSYVASGHMMIHRFMFMLARMPTTDGLGMIRSTMGNDAICRAQPAPLLPKTMWEMQMWQPTPEAKGTSPSVSTGGGIAGQVPEVDPATIQNGRCTHNVGETTMTWGEWRMRPATGEDFSYLQYQWVDCCLGGNLGP